MKLKKLILTGILVLGLVSCNDYQTSPSHGGNSGGSDHISTPDSHPTNYPATIEKAIENTMPNYGFKEGLMENSQDFYFEICTDKMFYQNLHGISYVIPDNDNEFMHEFNNHRENEDTFAYEMEVYGRSGAKESLYEIKMNSFLEIINLFSEDFYSIDEKTWGLEVIDMSSYLRDYFMNNSYRYCNYFELETNGYGRIEEFRCYEVYDTEKTVLSNLVFENIDLEQYRPYKNWKQKGQKFVTRIVDYKSSYQKGDQVLATYQNEKVVVEGSVCGFDVDGNVYVSTYTSSKGYVAIRVELKDTSKKPELKENVEVSGTVAIKDCVPYLRDASFISKGTKEKYVLLFDEETISQTYGGGFYAANIFYTSPMFADSIYSTYAYLDTLPAPTTGTYEFEVVCPYFAGENSDMYRMKVQVPSAWGDIHALYEELLTYPTINDENPQEIRLSNMVIHFDETYLGHIVLEATPESMIRRSLTPLEKVQTYTSIENFTFPNSEDLICFRFGGSTGLYIEDNYNLEEKDTIGVYFNIPKMDTTLAVAYKSTLLNLGFRLDNIVKDGSGSKHEIYKLNDNYLDLFITEDPYDETKSNIMAWIYEGTLVKTLNAFEELYAKVSWIGEADFKMFPSTYDADYTLFMFHHYGNLEFQDNELFCITLDVKEDIYDDYRKSFFDSGFSTLRDSNNVPLSYKARGVQHYIYLKEIAGGENLYLDTAIYPTTDYTYLGHKEFNYRIETLIYKGNAPILPEYSENINGFIADVMKQNSMEPFEIVLPSDCQVEYLPVDRTIDLAYGHYFDGEVYIYTKEVESAYDNIVLALIANGFSLAYTGKMSEVYSNGDVYFCLMKDSRNFIRIINSLGGVDF